MTSTSGLVGNFGKANYAAAKLGIVGLSKSIALDMARFHVRSNCVSPFAWSRLIGTIPIADEVQAARVEKLKGMTPAKIAPVAVFPPLRCRGGRDRTDVRGAKQRDLPHGPVATPPLGAAFGRLDAGDGGGARPPRPRRALFPPWAEARTSFTGTRSDRRAHGGAPLRVLARQGGKAPSLRSTPASVPEPGQRPERSRSARAVAETPDVSTPARPPSGGFAKARETAAAIDPGPSSLLADDLDEPPARQEGSRAGSARSRARPRRARPPREAPRSSTSITVLYPPLGDGEARASEGEPRSLGGSAPDHSRPARVRRGRGRSGSGRFAPARRRQPASASGVRGRAARPLRGAFPRPRPPPRRQ